MVYEQIVSSSVSFYHVFGNKITYGDREFHTFNEIIVPINCSSKLISETGTTNLYPESVVLVPRGYFHQFFPGCSYEDYHRVLLHFESVPFLDESIKTLFDRVKVIFNPTPAFRQLVEKLQKIETTIPDQQDKRLMLDSLFTEIILELKYNCQTDDTYHNLDPLISSIISYVDEHYTEPLSVDDISRKLHFSVSSLSHRFRTTMNTSLYRYILNKKLSKASELIKEGTPPTIASQQCGFQEYSGFYKQYKNYFGISPSKTES